MKFHSEDREILRDIYADDGWKEIYYFHQKYLLSPAQISRTIRKLENLKIIESLDYKIRMTEFGRRWLLSNRRQVFFRLDDMHWKTPLSKIASDHKRRGEYAPHPSKMRRNFFERIYEEMLLRDHGA